MHRVKEKIFPEIIRGVWITGGHFWKNLFFHSMHAMGLFKAIRAGVTIMYPEEKRKPPSRLRFSSGYIIVTPARINLKSPIACML